MMKKLLFTTTVLAALSGCSLNNDMNDDEKSHAYLVENAGFYTHTLESQAELKWLRLSVSDLGANLVITNELEQTEVMSASVVSEKLLFSANESCVVSGETFVCTIAGEDVSLHKTTNTHYQTLAQLAGDYQLRIDNEVVDISLDSHGRFVSQYNGCNLTGELVMDADFFTMLSDSNACETQESVGVVYINTYAPDPTMIEVYAENSLFSGDWLKR